MRPDAVPDVEGVPKPSHFLPPGSRALLCEDARILHLANRRHRFTLLRTMGPTADTIPELGAHPTTFQNWVHSPVRPMNDDFGEEL